MSGATEEPLLRSRYSLNPELLRMEADHWLTFSSGISINPVTGQVNIPAGMPIDDASRAFWESVKRLGPKEMRE